MLWKGPGLSLIHILAVFVVYPILMTLRMGFYQSYVYLTDTGTGFGLNSFRYVLQDPAFGLAVRNTMFIVLVGVPITIVLSLGAALLLSLIHISARSDRGRHRQEGDHD